MVLVARKTEAAILAVSLTALQTTMSGCLIVFFLFRLSAVATTERMNGSELNRTNSNLSSNFEDRSDGLTPQSIAGFSAECICHPGKTGCGSNDVILVIGSFQQAYPKAIASCNCFTSHNYPPVYVLTLPRLPRMRYGFDQLAYLFSKYSWAMISAFTASRALPPEAAPAFCFCISTEWPHLIFGVAPVGPPAKVQIPAAPCRPLPIALPQVRAMTSARTNKRRSFFSQCNYEFGRLRTYRE
jgi:hypothetical protein